MVDEKLASVPPVPGLGSEAIPGGRRMERRGRTKAVPGEKRNVRRRRRRRGGGRQIRNEFFCFEHPEKRSNVRENDPRLLLLGVVRRGAAWRGRAAQRRGKRRESEFGAPFGARSQTFSLQPCMQPVQHESHHHHHHHH